MKHIDSARIAEMLKQAIRWRQGVEAGEITGAAATYLGFPHSVHQWELDAICSAANDIFKEADSPLRIGNSMGELLPGAARQRELPLTEAA